MTATAAVFPANLVVEGRRCVVIGGGRVAAAKAERLAGCGADVHVIAPDVSAGVRAIAGTTWEERAYEPGDLDDAWLVVTATGDRDVTARVAADAAAARVWCNAADDPEHCTFLLPAVIRRGPVTVAVGTGGASPALASWLRDRLAESVGPEFEALAGLLADERRSWHDEGRSTEGLSWQKALDSDMLDLIRTGKVQEARERLKACLSSSSG